MDTSSSRRHTIDLLDKSITTYGERKLELRLLTQLHNGGSAQRSYSFFKVTGTHEATYKIPNLFFSSKERQRLFSNLTFLSTSLDRTADIAY
jgi:hypothetical protein